MITSSRVVYKCGSLNLRYKLQVFSTARFFYLEIRKQNNNKSTNKTNTGKANIYGTYGNCVCFGFFVCLLLLFGFF